ncbi:MAG: TauD/TfdA family dioxygenase [Burkholderiaceae bacterium]
MNANLHALADDSLDRADLPPPRTGPQVWYGPQMVASDQWLFGLSDTHVAEVEAAMRPLVDAGTDIATIRREHFPLPTLGPAIESLRRELIDGRGFLVMRRLPVERWSIREAATAYYGIGSWFGNARSQNGKGHLLGHVRDLGRDAVNDPTARVYQTRERQTFHTDSCDAVALLCLKTARSGGASALVSSMTIYNEMYRRRPDLLRLLFEPFATDRRGEVPEGRLPYSRYPVFNWYEGQLSAIYARRYIDSATRFDGVTLSPRQIEALDLFDSLAEDPALNMQIEFRPGDMQWVHNHTLLHDRTAYEDWDDPAEKRHLLRLWLALPGARPLSPAYAERYGSVTIGDRGGVIVSGTVLNAPLEPV